MTISATFKRYYNSWSQELHWDKPPLIPYWASASGEKRAGDSRCSINRKFHLKEKPYKVAFNHHNMEFGIMACLLWISIAQLVSFYRTDIDLFPFVSFPDHEELQKTLEEHFVVYLKITFCEKANHRFWLEYSLWSSNHQWSFKSIIYKKISERLLVWCHKKTRDTALAWNYNIVLWASKLQTKSALTWSVSECHGMSGIQPISSYWIKQQQHSRYRNFPKQRRRQ